MAKGGEIVSLNERNKQVRAILERQKDQIAMALPRHISVDRMLRVVLTSIRRTPKLLECDQMSLLGAVMEAAQLGLEPDGVLGHAYLVPYGKKVQLIPGYKGLIDLARRSGNVESIQARAVYEGDEFDFAYGDTPFLTHKPTADPGELLAVYAIAKLKGGETVFEVMWRTQVETIRKRSMAANNGPWVTDYDEMARKTAVRRLVKYLPLSAEVARAVTLDDMAEAGIPQDLEFIDVTAEVDDEPSVLDNLTNDIAIQEGMDPGQAEETLFEKGA